MRLTICKLDTDEVLTEVEWTVDHFITQSEDEHGRYLVIMQGPAGEPMDPMFVRQGEGYIRLESNDPPEVPANPDHQEIPKPPPPA